MIQNAQIRFLGLKCPKTNVRFQICAFEIGYRQNFVKRLESWYSLAQNTQIWAFVLEVWKRKLLENLSFPQFWNFESFRVVSQVFCVVLAGFGWFRLVLAGFGSFRLVLGFSKYDFKRLLFIIDVDVLFMKQSNIRFVLCLLILYSLISNRLFLFLHKTQSYFCILHLYSYTNYIGFAQQKFGFMAN